MSADIYVVAQRKVSKFDMKNVETYNALIEGGHEPPGTLMTSIKKGLGELEELRYKEPICIGGGLIEIVLDGDGDALYESGLVIKTADFPPDTIAIRVYSQC